MASGAPTDCLIAAQHPDPTVPSLPTHPPSHLVGPAQSQAKVAAAAAAVHCLAARVCLARAHVQLRRAAV